MRKTWREPDKKISMEKWYTERQKIQTDRPNIHLQWQISINNSELAPSAEVQPI